MLTALLQSFSFFFCWCFLSDWFWFQTLAFGDLESALDQFRLETNSGTTGDSHSHSHSKQTTLDGVLVATPTPSHGDCIRTAAAHGLGIFVEKPVAESPAEISELYAVCENSGDESSSVPLCCGFQRRFDASYANAARLLREKTIGTVSSARVVFGDSPGPSLDFLVEGGNIFSDLCVHDVDFLRWALGSGNDGGGEIETVFACGSSSREELAERNIQDHATMVLTTKGGTVATIALHRFSAYGYDQRCEFFGSTGNIEIGNPSETTTKWSGFDGGRSSRLLHSFDTRFRDAFANEVDAFADALLGVAEWPVTRDDVIRVQQVAEAAKRSLETNAVVRLEPPLASSSSS